MGYILLLLFVRIFAYQRLRFVRTFAYCRLLFVRIFAYRRLLFVRTFVAVSSVASTIGLMQCLNIRLKA